MGGKIGWFVVLCMLIAHGEALSCGQVTKLLFPCLAYLRDKGGIGSCCSGVSSLANAAKSTLARKAACTCLKSAAATITGINYRKAADLPSVCKVNIPYKISPSTDCSKYIN